MPKKKTNPKKKKLTLKEEEFCRLYASKEEFFGNGVRSYIQAYGPKVKYNSAKVEAHRLLTNPNILERINETLEDVVLNDTFVDKQLSFLIQQHDDFSGKLGAIREYNKLKNRINNTLEIKGEGLKELTEFFREVAKTK